MTARQLLAETLGSLMLTAAVVGSGILASDLSAGNDAAALLGNTAATAAILFVLVATLGPVSEAHFNPALTLAFLVRGHIRPVLAAVYIVVQIIGCILGAWLAHLMFELLVVQVASTERSGPAQMLAEGAATFALVFAILGTLRYKPDAVAAAVGLVIAAGYWWTASTSFANPAITIARALSDTFAGVRPADVPGFILGQTLGSLVAVSAAMILFRPEPEEEMAE